MKFLLRHGRTNSHVPSPPEAVPRSRRGSPEPSMSYQILTPPLSIEGIALLVNRLDQPSYPDKACTGVSWFGRRPIVHGKYPAGYGRLEFLKNHPRERRGDRA